MANCSVFKLIQVGAVAMVRLVTQYTFNEVDHNFAITQTTFGSIGRKNRQARVALGISFYSMVGAEGDPNFGTGLSQ